MPRHMPMIDLFYKNSQSQNLAGHHLHQKIRKYSAIFPNITGAVNHIKTRAPFASITATNAFTVGGSNVLSADSGNTDAEIVFNFNAKNSNSFYKDGQRTVNVDSAQILMIIKT